MKCPHLAGRARLAVAVLASAALLPSAADATADPADEAYLAHLRAVGFSWPPDHDYALTGMGRLICDDIGWGWTYDQIAEHIHATLDPRNVALGDLRSMVSLAHSVYCPNLRCWGDYC